jgi:hypothetical protein
MDDCGIILFQVENDFDFYQDLAGFDNGAQNRLVLHESKEKNIETSK